jgi:type III pantothenate kinase
MNLIIDIGNSSVKLALYNNGMISGSARFKTATTALLKEFAAGHKIKHIIVSSVSGQQEAIADFAALISASLYILSYKSKLPFAIEYQTPETLGADRIAAAAGAYKSFAGSKLLIIDAGTAITFDFLDGEIYRGGNISPGIDMRFRALNKFTNSLPLMKTRENFHSPGRNTGEAIVAGVVSGVTYEINEYIRTFEEKYTDLMVIITGGDGSYLKARISYECLYLPDIVTDGLNFILDYNAK